MNPILHAAFANAQDGIRTVETLVHHGVHMADINLILPRQDLGATATGMFSDTTEDQAHSTSAQAVSVSAARNAGLPGLLDALVPQPPDLCALFPRGILHDDSALLSPDATGYRYDALGAVIRDPAPPKSSPVPTEEVHNAGANSGEESKYEGLTAQSIPGVGVVAGTGTIVAGLSASGGLAGGIDDYLVGQGIEPEVAHKMSDQLAHGGTTLSIALSNAVQEAEIALLVEGFGGHLIH